MERLPLGCSGDKGLFPEIFSRGLSCAAHIIVRAITIRDYHKVYGDTVEIMGQVAGDLARISWGGYQGLSKNRRFFKL